MIVTNNKLVFQEFESEFVEGTMLDVLKKVRNYLHEGRELITSPIAASGRMHFSPVRSVIVSDEKKEINEAHISIVESAIININKALRIHFIDVQNEYDYQIIDYELLKSALDEIEMLKKLA